MAPTPPLAIGLVSLFLFPPAIKTTVPIAPEAHGMCSRWMQTLSTLLAFSAGAALIALMLQDAFEVMLLPRRVRRQWR